MSESIQQQTDTVIELFAEAVQQKAFFCTHRDPEGDMCSHQEALAKADAALRAHIDALAGVGRAAIEVIQDARQAAGLPVGASLVGHVARASLHREPLT